MDENENVTDEMRGVVAQMNLIPTNQRAAYEREARFRLAADGVFEPTSEQLARQIVKLT